MADDDARIDAATRKAIHDTFPMGIVMKSGSDNPLTIHSADPRLFRAIYALIAETLSVTNKLDRSTKEKIATLVSERNRCPVCVVAHTMMGTVAGGVEGKREAEGTKDDDAVLKYAESVLDALEATRGGKSPTEADGDAESSISSLDEAARAEVALVVLVFDHMNRVVSAIMGEEMSTAMMGVPRVVARQMEKPGLIAILSRWMSDLLGGPFRAKNEPGMTRALFDEETEETKSVLAAGLPDHLEAVKLAGSERATCIGRLLEWSKDYETELSKEGRVLSEGVVALLDRAIAQKASEEDVGHPGKVLKWANACVEEPELRSELEKLEDKDAGTSVAALLLCLSLAPQAVYRSSRWDDTVQRLGSSALRARCVVFWWSLRMTLRDAAGLKARQ